MDKVFIVIFIAADNTKYPHSFYGTIEDCIKYAEENKGNYVKYRIT